MLFTRERHCRERSGDHINYELVILVYLSHTCLFVELSAVMLKLAALVLLAITAVQALENGLVRTPPMGWLHWERFRCNVDCEHDPDNCIRYEDTHVPVDM